MTRERFGRFIQVDVCEAGCRGIWFDRHELEDVDHLTKGKGPALQQAVRQARVDDAARGPIECPRCDVPMRKRPHQFVEAVTVDECPGCHGVFLDAGELALIRDRPLSADEQREFRRRWREIRAKSEREQAGEAVFGDVAMWPLWVD